MWVGNQHDQPTGYGTIAKKVIQYVQHNSRHEMVEFAISGLQRVRPYEWDGVKVYSQSTYGGKMGLGDWASVQAKENPDVWMLNFDAWATADASGESVIPKIGVKYALYPPIDHDPLPPPWYSVLRNAVDIVPYCDFGARVMRQGLGPSVSISKPIHHGIDTSIFKPLHLTKKEVFGQDIDEDAFVVGIFKNNQGTRAKYELQLEACRLFLNTVQDERVRFFIMAHKTGNQSPNLEELIRRFGLSGKVFIIAADSYKAGLTAEECARYYNACDVVLNCVAGEGYGLPIIEAFGCGVPVIGTAFTSMPELILGREGEIKKKILSNGECYEGPHGWVVPTSGKEYTALKRSERRIFLPQDAAAALIQAYSKPETRKAMGEVAHEWVQDKDWNVICGQWVDYFDRLEEKVQPKKYTWTPLKEEEKIAIGSKKTACVVFSWNRPNYLVKTLDSLAKNTMADECDWFFYQDGWKNDEQYPYANAEDEATVRGQVQQCFEILTDFPFESKEIIANEYNMCIGSQLQAAKARLFEEYDNVIFFDDDHVVSEDYIELLLRMHEQYPDAIVGAQASEMRNIPSYAKPNMVGITEGASPGDSTARAGRWRWLAYLVPVSAYLATLAEMDDYMDFIGPSYRNIPHHAVRVRYGCEVTGFDGVMDVICNQHEIQRIATVIPRGRYIGETGLFGTPKIFGQMGFPRYDTIKFDEASYDRFVSPQDEPDRQIETPAGKMTPDKRGRLEGADQWLVDTINERVHEGDTVVDVGACAGYYTRLLSQRVGPSGKVYAFEPNPTNFKLLAGNTEGLENVILVNRAVSDKAGTGTLSLSTTNSGDHRLYDAGEGRETIEVDVVTLDEYFGTFGTLQSIDFIKIDAQGAEGAVFAGARNLIAASPTMVAVVEYAPKMMKEFGITANEMMDEAFAQGFSLVAIRDGGESIEHLTDTYKDNDDAFTDILIERKALFDATDGGAE